MEWIKIDYFLYCILVGDLDFVIVEIWGLTTANNTGGGHGHLFLWRLRVGQERNGKGLVPPGPRLPSEFSPKKYQRIKLDFFPSRGIREVVGGN